MKSEKLGPFVILRLSISEIANPLKNGDAKPRVYNHVRRDHDSQVAKDQLS
jgi:hypothetical protein